MSRNGAASLGSQLTAAQIDQVVPALKMPEYALYMGGTKTFKDDEVEDVIRSSVLPRNNYVMPSISNNAQVAKDALSEDPYNITLIRDLGFIYASEVQWDKAANVMMRGWKRASELKDHKDRFQFLMKLCETSFRNRQYRQAHAVYMDIEEPEDRFDKKAHLLLGCHVFAEINDAPKALATVSKAMDGEDFELSLKILAACCLRLKKVGAFEAAKNAVMNKARSGLNYHMDQSRMKTVEAWSMMSTAENAKVQWWSLEEGFQPWMRNAALALVVFLFICFLFVLESRSLRKLKLTA